MATALKKEMPLEFLLFHNNKSISKKSKCTNYTILDITLLQQSGHSSHINQTWQSVYVKPDGILNQETRGIVQKYVYFNAIIEN